MASPRLEQIATLTTFACAVVVTALVVRKEFGPDRARTGKSGAAVEARAVSDWKRYQSTGHRFGNSGAQVVLVEFGDFECPACRDFEERALKGARAKYTNDLSVVFRHWPLSYHRFAYPSARAAECAGAQNQFESFHHLLYLKQDSLGLKSYSSFARESGVPDVDLFDVCNSATGQIKQIDDDATTARALGGTGTPTLLLNDRLLGGVPDSAEFDRLVKEALSRSTAGQE